VNIYSSKQKQTFLTRNLPNRLTQIN